MRRAVARPQRYYRLEARPTWIAWQVALAIEVMVTALERTGEPEYRAALATWFARHHARRSRYYDDGLEREVRRARSEYLAALHRLAVAMTAFNDAQVPLHPDGHGRLEAWTREHVAVMRACGTASPSS